MPEIYLVGGAVRDTLLGRTPKDRDYLVVGATVQGVLDQGLNGVKDFKLVGADFPVFLHPVTGAEYALARKERKIGPGHTGFTCEFGLEVTVQEDLSRRDLTINSMAMSDEGELIDPFNGQGDLTNKVLRHTGIHFKEDPLRILRIARLLARFGPRWSVAPETFELCKSLVHTGALQELSVERIVLELSKGLSEPHPSQMFGFLQAVGANRAPIMAPFVADMDSVIALEDLFDASEVGEHVRWAVSFSATSRALQQSMAVVPTGAKTLMALIDAIEQKPALLTNYAQVPASEKLDFLVRLRYKSDMAFNPAIQLLQTLAFIQTSPQERASVLPCIDSLLAFHYGLLHGFAAGEFLAQSSAQGRTSAQIGQLIQTRLLELVQEIPDQPESTLPNTLEQEVLP